MKAVVGSSRFLEITGINGSLDSDKIQRFLHVLEYFKSQIRRFFGHSKNRSTLVQTLDWSLCSLVGERLVGGLGLGLGGGTA
jgi:hypothetical protein